MWTTAPSTALLDVAQAIKTDRTVLATDLQAFADSATGTSSPAPNTTDSMDTLADALTAAANGDRSRLEGLLHALATVDGIWTSSSAFSVIAQLSSRVCRTLALQLGSPERLATALDAEQALLADAMHRLGQRGKSNATASPALTHLFDSGIIGILHCDILGNILDANDAFLSMVGYSRDELQSGVIRWAEMTPKEWAHLDEHAVEQLQAHGVAQPWEKEYLRKDGSRVPIVVGVAMLTDVECIAFVLDISERKKLEILNARAKTLERQSHSMREASRLKSEFLANMSHELRTPLNSIIGFTDLLYDGEVPPSSAQHKEFLGDIRRSARHLLQIINDVLDLSKIEAGKTEFRPERLDVAVVVEETRRIVRTSAAAKNIKLEVEIDRALGPVLVDPARLKQVLYNYLSNAIKFTEEGGKVTVRALSEGDQFRIEVQDTGVGISAESRSRLFMEFEQLDAGTTKRHQGTGLGLALTKRLVEAQGGSVGVSSTPGKGSTFYALLPRETDASGFQNLSAPITWESDPEPSILVVEDDASDRQILLQTLRKEGYTLQTVGTGNEAISACRDRKFRAITLDLLLPDVTGLEVLHEVRNTELNRTTPVLVVSIVAERGIVGGYSVHDYLQKPIDSQHLLTSLAGADVRPNASNVVYVVDDDPSALKLARHCLAQAGYECACRAEPVRALEELETRRVAALILDLTMPDMDGFEFLARLRSNPRHRRTPVVIWTAKALSTDEARSLRRLAQVVLTKGDDRGSGLVSQLRLLDQRSGGRTVHGREDEQR